MMLETTNSKNVFKCFSLHGTTNAGYSILPIFNTVLGGEGVKQQRVLKG